MTATSELWDDGQLPGLGPITLIGQGFKLIAAHIVPVIVVFVVMSAVTYGSIWAMARYEVLTTPGLSAAWAGVTLVSALVGAVLSGFLLKALLGRPLGVDQGFLTYVGIITLVTLATGAVTKFLTPDPSKAGDPAAAMAAMPQQLLLLVLFLAWVYVAVKLMLWPIGVLVGDKDVTPNTSWKLTGRAFWGYILGLILLDLIPWACLGFLGFQAVQAGHPGEIGPLAAPLTALMGLFGAALAAAVYKLRRDEAVEA